ncbi:MAG: hypothetical protein AAF639_14725, partial [Chloroflexota bacterium]
LSPTVSVQRHRGLESGCATSGTTSRTHRGEQAEGTLFYEFTESFDAMDEEDISRIQCKIFQDGENPDQCYAKLTIQVEGREEFDFDGVEVVLQIGDETWREYSDPTGEVTFHNIKKKALAQGEISLRVINRE